MKVLMITNKVFTYALGFKNMVDPLMSLGHEVVWAADFSKFLGEKEQIPCKTISISIDSNPLKPCNIKALCQLTKIIREEKIEAIQCSTPIGGALGRLAGKMMGVAPVIYAAHGFLFFDGAPFINKVIFKLQEQLMARWTDALITITEEDYRAAQKFNMRGKTVPYLVHGAGVEIGRNVIVDRAQKRRELGVPEDAFVMVSAGFLNKNKNNKVLIEALGQIGDPSIYYLVCGEGKERDNLERLASQCGVKENVRFLGYRTDVAEIFAASDLFAMPSMREGVPRALLEAMDLSMACIGSRTRGITELLSDGRGGVLCRCDCPEDFAGGINALRNDVKLREEMGRVNAEVAKLYSKERVQEEMREIYRVNLV